MTSLKDAFPEEWAETIATGVNQTVRTMVGDAEASITLERVAGDTGGLTSCQIELAGLVDAVHGDPSDLAAMNALIDFIQLQTGSTVEDLTAGVWQQVIEDGITRIVEIEVCGVPVVLYIEGSFTSQISCKHLPRDSITLGTYDYGGGGGIVGEPWILVGGGEVGTTGSQRPFTYSYTEVLTGAGWSATFSQPQYVWIPHTSDTGPPFGIDQVATMPHTADAIQEGTMEHPLGFGTVPRWWHPYYRIQATFSVGCAEYHRHVEFITGVGPDWGVGSFDENETHCPGAAIGIVTARRPPGTENNPLSPSEINGVGQDANLSDLSPSNGTYNLYIRAYGCYEGSVYARQDWFDVIGVVWGGYTAFQTGYDPENTGQGLNVPVLTTTGVLPGEFGLEVGTDFGDGLSVDLEDGSLDQFQLTQSTPVRVNSIPMGKFIPEVGAVDDVPGAATAQLADALCLGPVPTPPWPGTSTSCSLELQELIEAFKEEQG